jgi:predicted ABC-type sugar transport system permease subunit
MLFAQHTNEETKPLLCVHIAVWHFPNTQVLAGTTLRKITKQVHKNLILFQTAKFILIFPLKSCYKLLIAVMS